MAYKTLSGKKAKLFQGVREAIQDTGALEANKWFEIVSVAETGSSLPTIGGSTAIFRSPDTGSANGITLAAGDSVYPLDMSRFCKVDANVSAEEGTIDVTDDCEDGYNAMILDGYATISGDISGFVKVDEETGALVTSVEDIFNRFFDVISDDGDGAYTYSPRENEKFILQVVLNEDAEVGEIQNSLMIPVLLTSFATGAGLKDAQKRDLNWTKGQGLTSLYKRTVASAADEV
jgi:hypothetical protein